MRTGLYFVVLLFDVSGVVVVFFVWLEDSVESCFVIKSIFDWSSFVWLVSSDIAENDDRLVASASGGGFWCMKLER